MDGRKPVINLERDGADRLLPKDFKEILTRRYFPVLGLTYIASVMGLAAARHGSFVHNLFEDQTAYAMALFVAFWVSVPSVLWIVLHGAPEFSHVADVWYKITASIMTAVLLVSYILLPEAEVLGIRTYCAVSIPIFFIMYFFFVKGSLPATAAHPLSALGLAFLLYGGILNFLY